MKTHKTLSFKRIIEAEFGNTNPNTIVKKLATHELYDFITNSISQINEHIVYMDEEIKQNGILGVSPIGAIMLIKFNEHFHQMPRVKEKQELEYILGCITKRILKHIIDIVPVKNKQSQLLSIFSALKDTSKLYGYDFDKLSEFMQLKNIILEVYTQRSDTKAVLMLPEQTQLPGFYCSNIDVKVLPQLIQIFNEENICHENEKLHQLFNNPNANLSIQFNENKIKYVLQFIAALKNSKFISYQYCQGFYQVFECHVKNFSTLFLNGKTPQRRVDEVKKLKDWHLNEQRFEAKFRKLVNLRDSA